MMKLRLHPDLDPSEADWSDYMRLTNIDTYEGDDVLSLDNDIEEPDAVIVAVSQPYEHHSPATVSNKWDRVRIVRNVLLSGNVVVATSFSVQVRSPYERLMDFM